MMDALGEPDFLVTTFAGTSMLPTLRGGDRILWRRVHKSRPPTAGAVVGRFERAKFVAHRLADSVAPGMVRTHGDACPFGDPLVATSEIAWVAVGAWREGRVIELGPACAPVRLAYRLTGLVRSVVRSVFLRGT